MKNILYMLVILLGMSSCKKEEFNYEIYQPQVGDVDSIYFSTGSPSLVADGQAKLQFVVEAFRKVQINAENGQVNDTMMYVDHTLLPAGAVQFFANGQPVEGMEFGTTETNQAEMTFYAQIGDVKSSEKEVQIRQPQALGAKRYVDVVFHVFELNSTDAAYDPLTYQEIGTKQLEEAIAYANEVFQNDLGKDPNGGVANIEFRLATKNASGTTLAVPGYNRILYNSTWRSQTIYVPGDFTNRINSTASYRWAPDRFLNIYILPWGASTSLGNNRAGYQIVPSGEEPLEGIAQIVGSAAEVPTTDFYTTYGLGVHRTVFFPGTDRKVEIASYLGTYYGLYRTSSPSGTTVDDYVDDTRKYLTGSNQTANTLNNLLKTAIDGEKFLANNAMDDIRYASLRNSFTVDQVERMRLVMERSPVRQAWFNE